MISRFHFTNKQNWALQRCVLIQDYYTANLNTAN